MPKVIHLPHAGGKLWIVTDGATVCWGLSAIMYMVNEEKNKHIASFFSAKLDTNQPRWLPCKVEAFSITTVIKDFAPFIVEARDPITILTDS